MAMSSEEMAATYPVPGFRFRVSMKGPNGEAELCCKSVSGLDVRIEYAEYRDGCGGHFQIPGLRQPVEISLSRAVFRSRPDFYEWINTASHNSVETRDITISLTDESGETPLVTWIIPDAKPANLTGPSLDGASNEVAVEQLALKGTRIAMAFS